MEGIWIQGGEVAYNNELRYY